MPDRIIRADLLESDRWLDLPGDSHRLVFIGLLLCVDDFGNVEGGRRLWRKVHQFTQIKTEADFLKVLSDLQDADLIRRYDGTLENGKREHWHLTRFRNMRRYTSRKCPPSPWCDATEKTSLEKLQEVTEKPAADLQRIDGRPAASLARGVGVDLGLEAGVEVNQEESKSKTTTAPSAPTRASAPGVFLEIPDWVPAGPWEAWIDMRKRIRKPPTPGALKLAVGKLERLRALGHDPTAVLNQSILGGWTGLYEEQAAPRRKPQSIEDVLKEIADRDEN